MPATLKRIAVILEGRAQYERNVLRGIRDFAAKRDDWLIRLELPGRLSGDFLKTWKPDGVLFQSTGLAPAFVKRLADFPAAIHLSKSPPRLELRSVGMDNQAIGQSAARYFLERGMEHFAFVGQSGAAFSKMRGDSFRQELKASGYTKTVPILDTSPDQNEKDVVRWLADLPKPCAVFSTHDECSLFLTTVCRSAGIRIPEEIAILGVDDDTLLCELAWPQLSSISIPSRRVGFEAAERLERILAGKKDSDGSTLLPPTGIVTRHSTDVHQTEDEIVNRTLRFMRSHIGQRINVDEVLREIGVSRRMLERRFAHHLGRSPLQEIQRLRMEEVRRLLLETRLPLHEIATRCGCGDASRLVTSFRKECGMTPGEFRKARAH